MDRSHPNRPARELRNKIADTPTVELSGLPGELKRFRQAEAAKILAELQRRQERANIDILVGAGCFERQIDFIRDPAKRKILFMPRRSGKSTALGIYLLEHALRFPNRKLLYLGLTSKSVTNIIWKDVIQREMKRLGLIRERPGRSEHFFDEHRGIVLLPNGSQIILCGLDSTPQRVKTLVGAKYSLVVIDEMQDIQQDVVSILEELEPAVSDYSTSGGGIIVLAGYPGQRRGENLWWKLTKQDAEGFPTADRLNPWTQTNQYGWKQFRWGVSDNPYMAEQFAETIQMFRSRLGDQYTADPEFRRQHLGHWVLDQDWLCYRFGDHNILAADQKLPGYEKERSILQALTRPSPTYSYYAGVDLGWEDSTAITVVAFSRTDPTLYVVHSEKMNHTVISQIGARLVDLTSQYNLQRIVIDTGAGGKLAAESLRQQFNLPVQAAVRDDKKAAVANVNSDLRAGLIKIIAESNKPLIDEMTTHLLDKKKMKIGEWAEDKKTANHSCDSFLYVHRESKHHHAVVPGITPPEASLDLGDHHVRQNRMERFERQAGGDWLDRLEEEQEAQIILETYGTGRR